MRKTLTCIICPNGCPLEVVSDGNGFSVTGNLCARGEEYAKEEMCNPMRTISSSIRLLNGDMEIVSVRLSKPVPKAMIFPIMEVIRSAFTEAPVHIGDVLIKNVLGTGADVIATRNAERR